MNCSDHIDYARTWTYGSRQDYNNTEHTIGALSLTAANDVESVVVDSSTVRVQSRSVPRSLHLSRLEDLSNSAAAVHSTPLDGDPILQEPESPRLLDL